MKHPSGNLLRNLVLFGRMLRGLGLVITPARLIDLVQALDFIDIGNRADFYFAMQSILVLHRDDIPLFDQAFELFWRKPTDGGSSLDIQAFGEQRRSHRPTISPPPIGQPPPARARATPKPPRRDEPPHLEITLTYSEREVLKQKDFAELSVEELAAIKKLISTFFWDLGFRRSRRKESGRSALIDFRKTFRRNVRYGGELIDLATRAPVMKPRPIIVLADISGSMERYSRLFLHFIYGLSAVPDSRIEAFLFSTRLTRVTQKLRGRDVEKSIRGISRSVPDWSGGTRIGESVRQFNFAWGRRVLGRQAAVLLISDGWDRGDPELLRVELSRLQRSCHHLAWLNPLLGSADYEPLTRGMQAALPYVDAFLPVHNLASLEQLARHLEELGAPRRHKNRQMRRTLSDPA